MRGEVLPAVVGPLTEGERSAWRQDVRAVQQSPAVPEQFRGKPREIFAVWLMGRELGIPPMRALQLFDVIDGRVSPRAELMTALATRAGHKIEGEADEQKATARGERGDNGAKMEVTFTIEEAEKAGLLAKKGQVWTKYRSDMLWARAVSRLVRRLCPDVLGGSLAVYASETASQSLTDEVLEAPALSLTPDDHGDFHLEVDEAGDGDGAGNEGAGDPAQESPAPDDDNGLG